MRHRIRLAAQIHDRVRDATRHIDKREIAELLVGPVEPGRQLCCQLEYQAWAFSSDLPEARIGHFGKLSLLACAYPGAAGRLFVEQPHLAKELALIEVGQHHFVAVLILDHYFDRTTDDVVKNVGQVPGMNDDCFRRYGPYPAVAQETIDCRDIAQWLCAVFHDPSLIVRHASL